MRRIGAGPLQLVLASHVASNRKNVNSARQIGRSGAERNRRTQL
jgi:hypothetical protein